MPRVHTLTVYQYAELGKDAQATAREWYRQCQAEDFDAEYVMEDAAEIARRMGIAIAPRCGESTPSIWWTLHRQGAGANFDGRYQAEAGAVDRVREHAPIDAELSRIAGELDRVTALHAGKRIEASIVSGRETHEHDTRIEVDVDGEEADAGTTAAIVDAVRDFMRWIYRQIDAEYDYRTSDEAVIEGIEANEYEFTEGGKRSLVID